MKSSHINHLIAIAGMCASAALWHYGHPCYSGAVAVLAFEALLFAIFDRTEDN